MEYFLREYLAYYVYKPIPLKGNLKNLNIVFRALKCTYFVLKVSRGLVTN